MFWKEESSNFLIFVFFESSTWIFKRSTWILRRHSVKSWWTSNAPFSLIIQLILIILDVLESWQFEYSDFRIFRKIHVDLHNIHEDFETTLCEIMTNFKCTVLSHYSADFNIFGCFGKLKVRIFWFSYLSNDPRGYFEDPRGSFEKYEN